MHQDTVDSSQLLDWVVDQLGQQQLVWFGTRGTDALPLLALPQFQGLFALIAPLEGLPTGIHQDILENRTGVRVDLDAYTIDRDASPETRQFYFAMAEWLTRSTFVATYRPCDFLASVCYPRLDRVTYLGMFHGLQSAFDHKGWVESELASYGVQTIPWRYYAYHEAGAIAEDFADHERFVVRANASDGGRGIRLVSRNENIGWLPPHEDHFLAVAPYLHPSVPVNLGACVFRDGAVSTHGPSIQLVGVPSCTDRTFAYCGNDFASVDSFLKPAEIDEIEAMVVKVGRWLHSMSYVGAFGIDVLVCPNGVFLAEVNPRFQGSSATSAFIDASIGRTDLYISHLAAHLGCSARADGVSLREIAQAQSDPQVGLSHLVSHNISGSRVARTAPLQSALGVVLSAPCEHVLVDEEATLFRLQVRGGAIDDTLSVRHEIQTEIDRIATQFRS